MPELAAGLKGEVRTSVTREDFAVALGSGDVEVLGTPRMIALAESATVNALDGVLEQGMTSVGTLVNVRHLAASPQGRSITARAELVRSEGKALVFRIEVFDDYGLVGEGTVERAIVDRAKFAARAAQPR